MEKLKALLTRISERGKPSQYLVLFQRYHEADIADALEELPKEIHEKFFLNVKPSFAVDVLGEMELENQTQLISEFKTDVAAKFIEEMEPDDAVDLLNELLDTDEEKAEEIIGALRKEEAKDIKELLAYKEDSAGAIMTSEFIAIPENLTVTQAVSLFKKQNPPDTEVSFYLFIINQQRQLIGHTTLRNLLLANPSSKVKEIRNDYPITAHKDDDQEKVAHLFQKYDMAVIPVIDENQLLLGIITIDDVVDVVVEEATEDIYKLSGTSEISEYKLVAGKIIYALKARLPWLLLTIIGGLISSFIINAYSGMYQPKLFSLALSLSFMPLLMGLGGNVGNQSSTIIVRGLSTGLVKESTPAKYILRELSVGFGIGFFISAVVFCFNYFHQVSLVFTLIVSGALWINITVAALIGSSLPILLKKCRVDPAVASAPFISSALDIVGQLIYFSLTIGAILWLAP
ncbi:magnesium transporter [Thermoproteota archaeon]